MSEELKLLEAPKSAHYLPESAEVDEERLRRLRIEVVMPKPAKLHFPEEEKIESAKF
jgi:hypothetical protein